MGAFSFTFAYPSWSPADATDAPFPVTTISNRVALLPFIIRICFVGFRLSFSLWVSGFRCRYLFFSFSVIHHHDLFFPEHENTTQSGVEKKKNILTALLCRENCISVECLPSACLWIVHKLAVFTLVALVANAIPHLNVTPPILFISCICAAERNRDGREESASERQRDVFVLS